MAKSSKKDLERIWKQKNLGEKVLEGGVGGVKTAAVRVAKEVVKSTKGKSVPKAKPKTAAKPKTPAQVRDAKIAQLKKALNAGSITRAEYTEGVREAAVKAAGKQAGPRAAINARASINAAERQRMANAAVSTPAAQVLRTSADLKRPAQMLGNVLKGGATRKQQAVTLAATVAGPWAVGKVREAGAKQSKTTVRVPTSNVDKAAAAAASRVTGAKKTAPVVSTRVSADRGRDKGASAAANIVRGTVTKPTVSKTTYTVKKGDSLWAIAKANKTTVDALLKANPELAKRKAAGKTTIFSGSKVRIPGKK